MLLLYGYNSLVWLCCFYNFLLAEHKRSEKEGKGRKRKYRKG